MREADELIEAWRRHQNTATPRSALYDGQPAPEAIITRDVGAVS